METIAALVICGVSGAGKSTVGSLLAARLGWAFLDADDFHPPANVAKMRRGEPLTDDDRRPWLEALRSLIARAGKDGRPLVLACSALKAAYRDHLGVDQRRVVSVFLDGSKDLIAERIANREHDFMPRSLLHSQFEALEVPQGGIRVRIDVPPEQVVERILDAVSEWR